MIYKLFPDIYIEIGNIKITQFSGFDFVSVTVIDRVKWLYDHRELIGGLRFVHEPKTLRFFTGKLEPVFDWPQKLLEAYIKDFGEDQ